MSNEEIIEDLVLPNYLKKLKAIFKEYGPAISIGSAIYVVFFRSIFEALPPIFGFLIAAIFCLLINGPLAIGSFLILRKNKLQEKKEGRTFFLWVMIVNTILFLIILFSSIIRITQPITTDPIDPTIEIPEIDSTEKVYTIPPQTPEIVRTTEVPNISTETPVLKPTKTDPNYGKARRPAFSALTPKKLTKYNLEPREWKEALRGYLIEKGHI